MIRLLSAVVAATLLSGCVTAASPRAGLDTSASQALADRIVTCDLVSFLRSEPDLAADRIIVTRFRRVRPEILYGPDFLRGGRLYDEDLERSVLRLRAARVLDLDIVGQAQERLTRPALDAFRRSRSAWRARAAMEEAGCAKLEDEVDALRG